MSRPIEDLSDKTFGNWKVLDFSHSNKLHCSYWLCQCSCGSLPKPVRSDCLKNGSVKSCGCSKKKNGRKFVDISGKTFGNWKVLKFSHISKRKSAYWRVQCKCGSEPRIQLGQYIRTGRFKSCGCEMGNYIDISPKLKEIMDGTLLGDAHVGWTTKNLSAFYSITSAKKRYIQNLSIILNDLGMENRVREIISHGHKYWTILSRTYRDFKKIREYWYQENFNNMGIPRKTIPPNFVISPKMLLFWYLGDGYFSRHNGKPHALALCSMGFLKEEVKRLQNQLFQNFSIESTTDKRQLIRIRNKCMNTFFDIIGSCPDWAHDYRYRWPNSGEL